MQVVSRLWGLGCLLPLLLTQCGGSDEAGPGGSGGSGGSTGKAGGGAGGAAGKGRQEDSAGAAGAPLEPESTCRTPSAEDYEPVWMPPRAFPGVCTSQQISQEYELCAAGSRNRDAAACRAFNVSKANTECLGCLFSAVGDRSSAAFIVFPRDNWLGNVGGCIALLDGDDTATGCGAKTQASDACQYGTCVAECSDSDSSADLEACRAGARVECAAYIEAAACRTLPRNARCAYSSFEEYFVGIGDVFCGSGPDGDGLGGAAGGGGGDSAGAGGAAAP